MLDLSKHDVVVLARLKWHQGKCIIKFTSETVGDDLFKDHARLLKKHGAAVAMVAFIEECQATTEDGKLHISKCSYNRAVYFLLRI